MKVNEKNLVQKYNEHEIKQNFNNQRINFKAIFTAFVVVFCKKFFDFFVLKRFKINRKFILKLVIKIIYLASKFYL